MEYSKAHLKYITQLRKKDKESENHTKPPLESNDVVQTKDYTFSKLTPCGRIGDSGQLLLAKSRSDAKQKYIVKHAYCDCAANEFIYTKLALGMRMPEVVLFQISEGEQRRCFTTEYIIGAKYLELQIPDPTYQQIREQAVNWQDYFRFLATYNMFLECDSLEMPLASDGYLYRVDTTNSFAICEYDLFLAGLNMEYDGINIKEQSRKSILNKEQFITWTNDMFDNTIQKCILPHGAEYITYYLEPFKYIQEISPG
ncbi:MAG: hypothetical protein RR091_11815 [Cloacibacillus sp.]